MGLFGSSSRVMLQYTMRIRAAGMITPRAEHIDERGGFGCPFPFGVMVRGESYWSADYNFV